MCYEAPMGIGVQLINARRQLTRLRRVSVVILAGTLLALPPATASSQSTFAVDSVPLRAWVETIYNKLKDAGFGAGIDAGKNVVSLKWSSGWQPPGSAVVTKTDGTVNLWLDEAAAAKAFEKDLLDSFGKDWKSKFISSSATIEVGEGAQAAVGARFGDLFAFDTKENRWRPEVSVRGFLHCGGITASVTATFKGALLEAGSTAVATVDAAASPDKKDKKDKKPSILKAKESIESAKAAVDKARSAIRVVVARLNELLVDRRVCSPPADEEVVIDSHRAKTFIPVLEALGWSPLQVFEGNTPEDIKKFYPQYENDPAMQASLASDTVVFTDPKDAPIFGGFEGDRFAVDVGGRLSYAHNAEIYHLGKLYVEEALRANPREGVRPEDVIRVFDIEPMLGFLSAAGAGANEFLNGKTQTTAAAIGEMICGEIKVQFFLNRYGPVVVVPEDTAAQEALTKQLSDESVEIVKAVVDDLAGRMMSFHDKVVEHGIPCPTDETMDVAKDDAEYRILDANVTFTRGNLPLSQLAAADISAIDEERIGAVADGVTRLVLEVVAPDVDVVRFSAEGAGADGTFSYLDSKPDDAGRTDIEVVTREVGSRDIAYVVYTVPASPGAIGDARHEGIGYREITVKAEIIGEGITLDIPIRLFRPPALLVHGTFSTPVKWTESSEPLGGTSMADALREAGIMTFLVDFQSTNGATGAASGFKDNRNVLLGPRIEGGSPDGDGMAKVINVFARPADPSEGIRQALDTLRAEYRIAATQVDVVGHSLGGLLPRVYASPAYQGNGDRAYKSPENWDRGDIRRLVTLCTPHFGSDLPKILLKLQSLSIGDQSFKDWAVRKTFAAVAAYQAGLSNASNATADQAPESPALKLIGATDIPSHAIACVADYAELTRTLFPDAARDDRNGQYIRDYMLLASFFGQSRSSLDIFANPLRWRDDKGNWVASSALAVPPPLQWYKPETPPDNSTTAGEHLCSLRPAGGTAMSIDDHERLLDILALIDWQKTMDKFDKAIAASYNVLNWKRSGFRIVVKSNSWYDALYHGMTTRSTIGEEQLMQMIRSAIFGNTPNDGVVRLESQIGGLENRDHVTILDDVVHGEAPLYGVVQHRVVELLTGGDSAFSANGFPAAGRLPTDLPPGVSNQNKRERVMAIARSNMVPSHAEAFARVAHARNEIVLARPVNADSTALILNHAGTKSMHVKGKSADWGPHAGYIPVDQRYSKLAFDKKKEKRLEKSRQYNCEVVKTFTKKDDPNFSKEIARRKTLTISIGDATYEVLRVTDAPPLPAPPVVVLRNTESGAYVDWRNPNLTVSGVGQDNTSALEVLTPPPDADGNDLGVYLTADYDLHAVGTRYNRFDDPTSFDIERGFISTCQKELVAEINEVVAKQTGYKGGNVVHHGPESQFNGSPGNDYPVTVFEPGKLGGWILTKLEGPKDDPDAQLKAYFLRKNFANSERDAAGLNWTMPWNDQWNWGEPDPATGRFKPPAQKEEVASESDDNDGETEEIAQCEPLPPCSSGVKSGDWDIGAGNSPDGIGCWTQ